MSRTVNAALRALIDAARRVDTKSDRDIYTDAPKCEDAVDELKDALEHLQTTARLAAQILREEPERD